MFWPIAIALLTAVGLFVAWPLLGRGSDWRALGLAVVLVLPLVGGLLYREVGTPTALNAAVQQAETADFDTAADNLRERLGEREEDLEGWLLLGRSLKSLQRFDEALEALETAQRIAPENPVVRVELAEAKLFASGEPRISDEVRSLLQSALAQDPGLQKALWLLGIDAAQRGDDEQAINLWQQLFDQVEAGSPVADSVAEQINLARARLGMEPLATSPAEGIWPGVTVRVALDESAMATLPSTLPETAVLFVIVRAAGETAGPPLGVARVDQPQFPLEVFIDDRNAMLPQRKLSQQTGLRFQARLSLAGQVTAGPGDLESRPLETQIEAADPISLLLESVTK